MNYCYEKGVQKCVLCWEVVLFLKVKNELLLWELGPEVCPLTCLEGVLIKYES